MDLYELGDYDGDSVGSLDAPTMGGDSLVPVPVPVDVMVDTTEAMTKYYNPKYVERPYPTAMKGVQWFSLPHALDEPALVRTSYGSAWMKYVPARPLRLLNLGSEVVRDWIRRDVKLPRGYFDPDEMYQGTDVNRVVHEAIQAAYSPHYDGTYIDGEDDLFLDADDSLLGEGAWEGPQEVVLFPPFADKLRVLSFRE